jgi:hypothetical protein
LVITSVLFVVPGPTESLPPQEDPNAAATIAALNFMAMLLEQLHSVDGPGPEVCGIRPYMVKQAARRMLVDRAFAALGCILVFEHSTRAAD